MLISVGMLFCGCGSDDRYDYDKGYESAWDGDDKPSMFSSKNYKEGYRQGQDDAAMYEDGYYDGYNKKKARHPKDPDYMDGFKDGCKIRNH